MHSTIVRAQNVFGFFTTVTFAVAALIACSDILAPRTPSANVTVKDVQVYVLSFVLPVLHRSLPTPPNSAVIRHNILMSEIRQTQCPRKTLLLLVQERRIRQDQVLSLG